jgi:hypothetical protein
MADYAPPTLAFLTAVPLAPTTEQPESTPEKGRGLKPELQPPAAGWRHLDEPGDHDRRSRHYYLA